MQFTVKPEMNQPDPAAVEEARTVLDLHLHRGGVSQPIEFAVLIQFSNAPGGRYSYIIQW